MKMRRFIQILSVIVSLSLVSCEKVGGDIGGDNEVTVSYTVSCDAVTKSIGEASAINYVSYAVYLKKGAEYVLTSSYDPVPFTAGNADCPVLLTRGQSYKVVFVAQHYEGTVPSLTPAYPIDFAAKTLSSPTAPAANSENYDLFYIADEVNNYTGSQPDPVELNRIVALVSLKCSQENWDAAEAAGKRPTHSDVTVKNVPQSFNLLTGTVSPDTHALTYAKSQIAEPQTLAYAYCLPAGPSDVEFRMYTGEGDVYPKVINAPDVPVEKNKKTNINGAIIY